jgi:hypothetical protein
MVTTAAAVKPGVLSRLRAAYLISIIDGEVRGETRPMTRT